MSDPVQRVVAVDSFLIDRIEDAFRVIVAANILEHDGITRVDKALVVLEDCGRALAVRGTEQNCGDAARADRPELTGCSADTGRSVPDGRPVRT